MEWRCEWCGKPHESDDPPCDNCGHSKFEKAIVQQAPSAGSDSQTTEMWVCTECGRHHPKNSPPCSRCGNATLTLEEIRIDETNLTDGPSDSYTPDSKPEATEMTVWVCTECGRDHPKHSPPCSRCGNVSLEQQTKRFEAGSHSVPGYLDVLTPTYAVALSVVLIIASVFVLGLAGIVDIPGMGTEVPDIENPPGEATETNGTSHADIEAAYLEAINEHREQHARAPLERNAWLDDVATYVNQFMMVAFYAEQDETLTVGDIEELLAEECDGPTYEASERIPVSENMDAEDAGEQLSYLAIENSGWQANGELTITGIDVHSIDDQLYLMQYAC